MKGFKPGAAIALCVACCAYASAGGPAPQFKAGGAVLTLPAPRGEFVEVGDKLRTTLFEVMVPSDNRLVSAYATQSAGTNLLAGKTREGLQTYGLIEVPRRAEYADCTPQDFEEIRKNIEPSMRKLGSEGAGSLQDEMNLRLRSLDVGKIEVGRPEMLGHLFAKTDAFGFAMLVAIKQADRSVTMAVGVGIIRVKQRALFVYLYRNY